MRSSEIQKLLEHVGLTETEATIYLTGLEAEVLTVQELCTRTTIKRPTIYHALGTLEEKGLVKEERKGSKTAFRMQPPVLLQGWIDAQRDALTQKERTVQEVVEKLVVQPTQGTTESVHTYQDRKNVQAVFELALYARSKKCTLVFPSKEFLSQLDPNGIHIEQARLRGMDLQLLTKRIGAALLIYEETVVLMENPSRATVIASALLAATLSSLL